MKDKQVLSSDMCLGWWKVEAPRWVLRHLFRRPFCPELGACDSSTAKRRVRRENALPF